MKLDIKNKLAMSVLIASSAVLSLPSQAAPIGIIGSSSIGSSGVTVSSGNDLANPGLITVISPKSGLTVGDYSPIPVDTVFQLGGSLDLTDVSTWNIIGPLTFGSFIASELAIIDQSISFLNVFTRGIFSPGSLIGTQAGGCATNGNTCAPTDTSIRWTFSQSGGSISAGGSLASPAVPLNVVPVPATLALFWIGLAGLLHRYRRRDSDPLMA